jgi:hypothetical protein
MKLIPPVILEPKSAAEEHVFRLLQQTSFSHHDIALHSLNMGKHDYKKWCEADFVIISSRGILVLEVKGGRVACKDGVWEFQNRFNETTYKNESPAAQASSAFFALRDKFLYPRFKRELNRVPMGWAVVFRDVPRLTSEGVSSLPEQPDEITAYKAECSGTNTFLAFLDRAFEHWASKVKQPSEIAPSVANALASFLRPNFERFPSLNSRLQEFRQQLSQLTEEQYERLDELQENDRLIITGGAGTGKTFLAIASARYDAAAGRSVLLVTRGDFLARFIASHDLPSSVTVTTIADLRQTGADRRWDTLIVDEGQDVCSMEALDLLGSCLIGGLENGRWRWFGDPNRQVSVSYPLDPVAWDYLESLGFKRRLKQNIRNAPKIVEAITDVCGADMGSPRPIGVGSDVSIEQVNDTKEIISRVRNLLTGWMVGEAAVPRNDIVVLCGSPAEATDLSRQLTDGGVRAEALSERALGGRARDCVLVASTEDFKGLERPVVCIAGIPSELDDDDLRSHIYKGFSRANHTLTVVCTKTQAAKLASLAALSTNRGGRAA